MTRLGLVSDEQRFGNRGAAEMIATAEATDNGSKRISEVHQKRI